MSTIFALSSGAVPAGVAVFRLSGPQAKSVMNSLVESEPKPRDAALRLIRDPRNGELIDQALVLYFPAPHSFTGEECVEFHCHGGRAVVQAMLDVMGSFSDCRLAEAGEFSRRAFENGKMDLTAVEGLADLIHAETEMQRRQAMRQASGQHRQQIDEWRSVLLYGRSMIEAELDFSDEEDIPGSVSDVIWPKITKLKRDIEHHLGKASGGERLRNGLSVVLIGHPNAGKSSLLNYFAKREVAIVTEEAGTTRDLLEVHLDIEGYPVTLVDTAGLRDASNIVEKEGIRRALDRSRDADLLIELIDMSADQERVEVESEATRLVLLNKTDLCLSDKAYDLGEQMGDEDAFAVSVKAEIGMDEFYDSFVKHIEKSFTGSENTLVTQKRHVDILTACVKFLDDALIYSESPIEIRSEYLRMAGDELGKITGQIDIEEMLGVIFSQFCVGK
ncbi:MAG: tRNA uridine-5-carboxymethylaminomethyl(34) synthesis GTPase MnmE [Cohaesibacter sp.]|jgi:tRNA modification GTPase|nr:tRNA uridine-5-carboxymethylaminomethyl(34) synthesis GTPase MnmE [Cohaesibacter sp.]